MSVCVRPVGPNTIQAGVTGTARVGIDGCRTEERGSIRARGSITYSFDAQISLADPREYVQRQLDEFAPVRVTGVTVQAKQLCIDEDIGWWSALPKPKYPSQRIVILRWNVPRFVHSRSQWATQRPNRT